MSKPTPVQGVRGYARFAWDVVRDIAGPATKPIQLSWREAMRILRKSVAPALWERLVGFCIFVLALAILYIGLQLTRLWRLLAG